MDSKKILEDLSTLSYNELKDEDLHKILDKLYVVNKKIITILSKREKEEDVEATEVLSASMAKFTPMFGFLESHAGKGEYRHYLMSVNVGNGHNGIASIKPAFMLKFKNLRKKYSVEYITRMTMADGIDGAVFMFNLDSTATQDEHTTTDANPVYYLTLPFFFDWIESRKEHDKVSLNTYLEVVDEDGNDVHRKVGAPRIHNIKGYFRSPRLEQYIVTDLKMHTSEIFMSPDFRLVKAFMTPERETYWKDIIDHFDDLGIKYPQPDYFSAEEDLRSIKKATGKMLKGTGILQF